MKTQKREEKKCKAIHASAVDMFITTQTKSLIQRGEIFTRAVNKCNIQVAHI